MAPFLLDTKSSPPRGAQKKKIFWGGHLFALDREGRIARAFRTNASRVS